jgi:hypothetical protein
MGIKNKSGLHKEISSIFSGVPLQNNDVGRQPVTAAQAADKTEGHIPPMPPVAVKPPQISLQEPVKADTADPGRTAEKDKKMAAPAAKAKAAQSKLYKCVNEFWQKVKVKLLTPQEGVTPARHTAMLISVPALLLVVVFVFGRLFLKSGARGNKTQDDTASALIAPKTEIEWQKPSVYPANLRDPMKRASEQGFLASGAGDVVVRGIVWSQDNPVAIIGTQIVYQGQTVDGVKIVKISKDSVEFEKDGKTWTEKVAN